MRYARTNISNGPLASRQTSVKSESRGHDVLATYRRLVDRPDPPPAHWQAACTASECSFHQLGPYIGKLKSSIARDLINRFSESGDLVVDPFAGSGTVLLEAVMAGRRTFGADVNPYAAVLTKAKLSAPPSLKDAFRVAEKALAKSEAEPEPDLRHVPPWVRAFFHPKTLKETIQFASVCGKDNQPFLMACLLGILHHQREGFLSFPSSHLVPYLRDKKYPKSRFPQMYEYRPLASRLMAKLTRAYRCLPDKQTTSEWKFRCASVQNLSFPKSFDCIITSPPYMNALDYVRDNRLRLWFLDPTRESANDNIATRQRSAFVDAIQAMAVAVENHLTHGGRCVMVVGERVTRSFDGHPSQVICSIIQERSPSLRLVSLIRDQIPDIRRSRKKCGATKMEHILVFRRA